MLVVIGPQWVSITDNQGNRRLFEPNDYTRLEVETGLVNKNIVVIPVFVMGASMPSSDEIPDSLADLRLRNAISVRNDPDFTPDMQRLIQGINEQFPSATKSKSTSKKERKPMDPITLATAATSLLAPYLKKAGEKALDKIAEQLPDTVGKVWNAISNKSSSITEAASDLAKDPDDADNVGAFRKELRKAFEKDQDFAGLLTDLIEKAKNDPSINISGDGVVATGGSIANNFNNAGGNISGSTINISNTKN